MSRGVKPRAAWLTSGPWSRWNTAASAASTGSSLITAVKVRWRCVSGIGLLCGAVGIIRELGLPSARIVTTQDQQFNENWFIWLVWFVLFIWLAWFF
jgi:hypothetical protein